MATEYKLTKIPVASKPKDNKKGLDVAPPSMDTLPSYPPSFSASEKQISEVADWEPEEEYRLVIDIIMTSKVANRNSPVRGDFDILGYKILPPPPTIEEMNDKEYGAHIGEKLAEAARTAK